MSYLLLFACIWVLAFQISALERKIEKQLERLEDKIDSRTYALQDEILYVKQGGID